MGIPRLNLLAAPAGGTLAFNPNGLDSAAANTPGAVGYCRVDSTWTPLDGVSRTAINKLGPHQRFVAPSSAASPSYDATGAGGKPCLTFATDDYMEPSDWDGMAAGTTQGFFWAVAAYVGTGMLTGSPFATLGAEKVLNINLSITGGTEFIRLMDGANVKRVQESVLTDLGTGFNLLMFAWGNGENMKLYINNSNKTLDAADSSNMTDGRFQMGRRGGVFSNFKIAAWGWGNIGIGAAEHDARRDAIYTTAKAEYTLP